MDFSSALVALRMGIPMRRAAWPACYRVMLVPEFEQVRAHFMLYNDKQEHYVPHTKDILATDWDKYVSVPELIQDSKPKPPTQGIIAQGFEAFGPMGERHGSAS